MAGTVFQQRVSKTKTEYLLHTREAAGLANFSLVAGLKWTGPGGGGEMKGIKRMVPRLLLQRVDFPAMSTSFQELMFSDGDNKTLRNFLRFLYHRR